MKGFLDGAKWRKPSAASASLIANDMRSPASATNSERATYDFLIANEFHSQNTPNWLSPSLPAPGALARPSQSLATSHSVTLPALTQEGRVKGRLPFSNRYSKLLESPVTRTKQTVAPHSNRYKTQFSATAFSLFKVQW